jgi:terminal uridylyltransferase
MFPSSQDLTAPSSAGSDLENRLRSLILNNANEKNVPGVGTQLPISSYIPPHMSAASPNEQHEYLARTVSHPRTSSSSPAVPMAGANPAIQNVSNMRSQPGLGDSSRMPRHPPQHGRKRPNQAQRRQINSHLSYPLDARQDPSLQSGRGYSPMHGNMQQGSISSQFNSSRQSDFNRGYSQQQQYSPRFPIQSQASQHSPHSPYSQNYRQPPVNHNRPSPAPGYGPQSAQESNQTQQYQDVKRPGPESFYGRPTPANRQLYQPSQYGGQGRGRQFGPTPEEIASQSSHLAMLLQDCVLTVGIDSEEEAEKETFRAVVENECREAIREYEQGELGNPQFDSSSVELKCFGSMSSGFATRASDMDLALLTPLSRPAADSPESPIPRLLERTLLNLGYGARLLTRTRVPIIKLCQKPTQKLLSGLLEARMKWENGFNTEPEDEDEDVVQVETKYSNDDLRSRKENDKPVDSPEPSATGITAYSPESTKDLLAKLKQKNHQSLGDYFNVTKRLLRKVGGRDISAGSPPFSTEEYNLLNAVCKAFISGLSSEPLVMRLHTYQSITPLFDSSLPPILRSLNGVWTQIEGERFALAFESRPLTESNEKQEQECLKLIEEWRSIQNQSARLIEPLIYNRQLYVAAEKLKAISSLQLVLLEQMQYEDPVYYQKRAERILDDLTARDQRTSDIVTPVVVSHYISGISNPEIREDIRNSSYSKRTLKDVAIQHRIFQLIVDYEYALNHNTYEDADRSVVEKYLAFLRIKGHEQPVEPNLIARIRTLPDPTVGSPNKPRDRYRDKLEFPKTDIGIQCDINFSAHLALHNTLLLRCYAHSDHRVKPLILFIKHWAKVRGINTPYRGSLSSYGYVLMVLHYLVNIAQPFVCPNLQLLHRDPPSHLPQAEIDAQTICLGRDVRFWRNESEIKSLSSRGMLNHNHDSVGLLLRGFFEYFAQGGQMTTVQSRGFDWGREVISLRTQGGIMSKQEKGWVGAKTVIQTTTVAAPSTPSNAVHPKEQSDAQHTSTLNNESEVKSAKNQVKTVEETKEIRNRYLFAIEDPFELDHNVARTVTHNGIVSIRDEFRRAWRLIKHMGKPEQDEGLLDPPNSGSDDQPGLHELLDLIHGKDKTDTKIVA